MLLQVEVCDPSDPDAAAAAPITHTDNDSVIVWW